MAAVLPLVVFVGLVYLAGGYALFQAFLKPAEPPKGQGGPEAYHLVYETLRLRTSRVGARYFAVPDARATAVMVPAVGGTVWTLQGESLGPFVRALTARHIAVVTLPGFHPRVVAEALDVLARKDIPAEQIILVGFSLGGSTALQTAAERPVGGVVADGVVDDVARELWRDVARQGVLVRILIPALRLFFAFSSRLTQAMHALNTVSHVTAPILLVYGEVEPLVTQGLHHGLLQRAAETDRIEVWIVPETGHCFGPVDHPDLYADRLFEFGARWVFPSPGAKGPDGDPTA